MENSRGDGYISEKIVDSFRAGTIPIYYGDYLVDEFINPKTYILIRWDKDIDAKIEYIKKIDNDDKLYMEIMKEKPILDDKFVEKIDAPVTDSLMGKGAFDGLNPRYTGMLGMHGCKASNLSISECDLLIAIGTRFSDRVLGNPAKFASKAKVLQFDVDPAEINKNIIVNNLSGGFKNAGIGFTYEKP